MPNKNSKSWKIFSILSYYNKIYTNNNLWKFQVFIVISFFKYSEILKMDWVKVIILQVNIECHKHLNLKCS